MAAEADQLRRQEILTRLRGRRIDRAVVQDSGLLKLLEQEADSGVESPLIDREYLNELRQLTRETAARPASFALFAKKEDVFLVPGFLGSSLTDQAPRGHELIWVDPTLVVNPQQLNALQLAALPPLGGPPERDAAANVRVEATGAVPVAYDLLMGRLELNDFNVTVKAYDWRKNLDEAAANLAMAIKTHDISRKLHLVAHSQGSLVARRALQLLGPTVARQKVRNLVLMGPASFGTFSAAFAIAGNVELLEMVKRFGVRVPAGIAGVLQSMTGLYQLLPWKPGTLPWLGQNDMSQPSFWKTGVDQQRLTRFYGQWGASLDSSFFNDRTVVILGDAKTTIGVKFQNGKLVESESSTEGDGTVPDSCAILPGVPAFRAPRAEHGWMGAAFNVAAAVKNILLDRDVGLESPTVRQPPAAPPNRFQVDEAAAMAQALAARKRMRPKVGAEVAAPDLQPHVDLDGTVLRPEVPRPQFRRLRVYSFDPLLGGQLADLKIETLMLEIPWDQHGQSEDGDLLEPGPVGDYLEVVDFDPASDCCYPPVDLNHPHILAQDGLEPREADPQFHQQMTYAVAMNTIRVFERALGRTVLWSPRIIRNTDPAKTKSEFVQRLRIYPHALRQANAFYHPELKALLFGYFPVLGSDIGRNLPGGTVFTCLSYDVVAHETTHAILDGMHRYFTEPSNPDVFAFHEAFADLVALFQHFSHAEILKHQLAKSKGDLSDQNLLGQLAHQFGEATGRHGALRRYLGEEVPDRATRIRTVTEPHERGAILTAAVFEAFLAIYRFRIRGLNQIAAGGGGFASNGNIHPELVELLAAEAAKAASHMLNICIRAIDYVPPTDITFGEYLRAMITADYDLIRNDDLGYRVAIIEAFRQWGIYPPGVRSLSEDSLRWGAPEEWEMGRVPGIDDHLSSTRCAHQINRRQQYERMQQDKEHLHQLLSQRIAENPDACRGFGLALDRETHKQYQSIRVDKAGQPVFEIHSARRCRRIGPDGQQLVDLVVEVVQRRKALFDDSQQKLLDSGEISYDDVETPDFWFRGGCTVIIDPCTGEIRYCIRKRVTDDKRLQRERDWRLTAQLENSQALYRDADASNPFAMLHDAH